MKSEKIKTIIEKANLLLASVDMAFDGPTRTEADELLFLLLTHASKSPTFAVAVVRHVQDQGFMILELDTDNSRQFQTKFSKALSLDERSMATIKIIVAKLFR